MPTTYFGADKSGRITTCQIKTEKQDINAPCQLHINGHDTDKARLVKTVFANAPLEDLFEDNDAPAPSASVSALDYLKEINSDHEYAPVVDENAIREERFRKQGEDEDAIVTFSNMSFEEQASLGGLPSAYKIEQVLEASDVTWGENVKLSKKAEAEVLDNALKLIAIIDLDSKNKKPVFSEETRKQAEAYRTALFEPSNLNKDGTPKLVYDVKGSAEYFRGGIMDTPANRKARDMDSTTDYGHDISETLTAIYLGVKYEAIKNPEIANNVENAVSAKVGRPSYFIEDHNRYASVNKGFFARLLGR